MWGVDVADIQDSASISLEGANLYGTSKWLSGSNAITNVWGEGNFILLKFTPDTHATKVEVGIKNLVELDSDKNALIKVEDKYGYKLRVIQTFADGTTTQQYINLDTLTTEGASA